MIYIIAFSTLLACAVANAFRGSGAGWLRPVIGALAGAGALAATGNIVPALIVAGGVWLWLMQPWGQWYAFGWRPDRPLSQYESQIERIARIAVKNEPGLSITAWSISATLFSLPLAVLASPWWLLLGPLSVLLYNITFRFAGQGPHVRYGEISKGALIGLMAVMLAGCAVPYREPAPDWGGISREVGRIINQ